MGTAKRERKKENRRLKLDDEARRDRARRTRRLVLRVLVVVGVALGIGFLIWLAGRDDAATEVTDDSATATETETTEPAPDRTFPPPPTGDTLSGPTPCPPAEGADARVAQFAEAPPVCIEDGRTYTAIVETNLGSLTIELDPAAAPITVNNFVVLARYRYFDGTECHRAIPKFVVQCGDPTASGTGDPGYSFVDELPAAGAYRIGSLAMANSGPNTNGSQFFIVTGADGANLPPQYSLFGRVTAGLDTTLPAMDALGNAQGNGVPPLEPILIRSVTIVEG
jgi:peptidyl-prolyl cis-trans isomerase B (cyclophilin B)